MQSSSRARSPHELIAPRWSDHDARGTCQGHLVHRCLHNNGSPIPTPRPSFMASSYSSCIAHCSKSFSKMSKTCDHLWPAAPRRRPFRPPVKGLYKTWTHTFCRRQAFTYQGPWLLKSPKYAEKCCESRGSSFRLDEAQTDLKPPTGCSRGADNVCLDSRFRGYITDHYSSIYHPSASEGFEKYIKSRVLSPTKQGFKNMTVCNRFDSTGGSYTALPTPHKASREGTQGLPLDPQQKLFRDAVAIAATGCAWKWIASPPKSIFNRENEALTKL